MAKNKAKSKRKSITQTADKMFRLFAFIGPEAGTVYAGGFSVDAIAQALSLKTGFNFKDGSMDFGRLAMGWGPILGYEAAKKGKAFISRLLSSM